MEQIKSCIVPWMTSFSQCRRHHRHIVTTLFIEKMVEYEITENRSASLVYQVEQVPVLLMRDATTGQEIPGTRFAGAPSDANMLQFVLHTWEKKLIEYLEFSCSTPREEAV